MYYHFQKRQSKGHEAFIKYLCFSVWCLPLSFSSACLLIFCVPGVFFYLSSAVNPIIYNLLSHRFQAAFRTVIPPSCQQQHSHNHSLGPSMQRNIFLTECHLVELTEDVAPQFPRQLSVLSFSSPQPSVLVRHQERSSQRADIHVVLYSGRVGGCPIIYAFLYDMKEVKWLLELTYPILVFSPTNVKIAT